MGRNPYGNNPVNPPSPWFGRLGAISSFVCDPHPEGPSTPWYGKQTGIIQGKNDRGPSRFYEDPRQMGFFTGCINNVTGTPNPRMVLLVRLCAGNSTTLP